MAKLMYAATAADGKKTEGFVEADSVLHARELLQARGLADVVLYNAPGLAVDEDELRGLDESQLRALARLRMAVMQKPGITPVLAAVARAAGWWLVMGAAAVAYGLYAGQSSWVWGGVLAIGLPFAHAAWNWRHAGRYQQMLKAFAVGRWPEVRRLATLLARHHANKPVMAFEFELRLAYVDAREGHLEMALARVEPWRARLHEQAGLFEMRVAMLHHAAGDDANFVGLHAEALRRLPGDPTRTMDLALAHARFGDVDEAARLLDSVDLSLLPPWGMGFVHWTRGLVLLRRQQPEALATLGQAVAEFLKLSAQPTVWTALAFATLDHAVALHAAGRKDEARRSVHHVWPIVRAHAQPALLHMLDAEGLAPESVR